jgi:hypothetical protein
MWNNIQWLNSLANFIQWAAIIMVFIGGMLQLGKYFVENRIKNLKEKEVFRKELLQQEHANKLISRVDTLKIYLDKSKNEIIELRGKTKFVNPNTQPIQSGIATVSVRIKTSEILNEKFWDSGGSLKFVKDNQEILTLSDTQCTAISISPEIAVVQGVFNLDANHRNIGTKITFLKESQLLKIQFLPFQKQQVIDGKVVCIFNGNARLEFSISPQTMKDSIIFVKNIKQLLEKELK